MADKLIAKVVSWEKAPGVPGVGWLRCRISDCEVREYKFNASTKQPNYQPIRGDRVSFELAKKLNGLEYIRSVMFIRTGN